MKDQASDQCQEERIKNFTPDEFARALRSLKIDDWKSIAEFNSLLYRPNFSPIDIGCIEDPGGGDFQNSIIMIPDPGQLDAHILPENYDPVPDYQPYVSDAVLGLWNTPAEF